MIYVLFLLISCLYFSYLKRYRCIFSFRKFLLYSLPFIIFWGLLIGGQYGVGTDYFSYIRYFSGADLSYFESKGDVFFVEFIKLCNSIGIWGQGIFFVLAFISVIILLYVIHKVVGSKYAFLFLFIFIVFSGTFHNQMNGVRQYCAVYLFSIGMCLWLQKKYLLAIVFFSIMSFVHSSSIAVLLIFLFLNRAWGFIAKRHILVLIVFAAFFVSLLNLNVLLQKVIPFFDQYAVYYNSGRIEGEEVSKLVMVTKYIYIPVLLYSIYLYPRMQLNTMQQKCFVLGVCGYAFKISILSLFIVNRMGQYFEILMCIPMVFLLIYIKRQGIRYTYLYLMLILFFFIPYALKVTYFAKGEYLYHSFFLL